MPNNFGSLLFSLLHNLIEYHFSIASFTKRSFSNTPIGIAIFLPAEFKQSIFGQFLENLFMYQFNLEGDMGRHHLSISGAYTECGISTSTINRSAGKTFPPKVKLSEGRVGFRLYQIEEWLNGKRGGWN